MLKIATIPVLTRMIAKLDLMPIIEKLKQLDIFEDGQIGISAEQAGVLTFEILADLAPQLGKVGADIPEFVALYKGCSIQEANEFDIAEIFNEIKNDDGILSFFKRALLKKAEHEQ